MNKIAVNISVEFVIHQLCWGLMVSAVSHTLSAPHSAAVTSCQHGTLLALIDVLLWL